MEQFDIRQFLSWLALFIFGMDLLEDTIKSLGYAQLKKFLSKTINTRFKSMIAGTVLAGVLQSGTVVSMMLLAFVWAGVVSLVSAVGVIVWANVWGTFLALLVSKLWFEYKITAFALPLLWIWGLSQFITNKTLKQVWLLVLWFGMLLFGLSFLKDSVSILTHTINLWAYATSGWWLFFFGWIILALILHSSGTATVIAQVAFAWWLIGFDNAIYIMLGASIGSSLVPLYTSIGWSYVKRQVAWANVIFNVFGAVLFLWSVPWLEQIFTQWYELPEQWPFVIAIFQLFYNLAAAIIAYPLIPWFTKMLQKYIHGDQLDYQLVSLTNAPSNYESLLQKDMLTLAKKIYKFNVHHMDIDQKILLNSDYTTSEKHYAVYHLGDDALDEDYDILQNIEESMLRGLLQRIHQWNSKQDAAYLKQYELIETMMYSAKTLHDNRENFTTLIQSDSLMVKERLQYLKEQMVDLYQVIADFIASSHEDHDRELTKLLAHIDGNSLEITNLLGQHLHREALPWGELSALLHLTSSLQRSHHAIVQAVKELKA
jgi:phosphate:Na+ symporter